MNIYSKNDKNFLYDLPTSNDEGAQKKTDAQYSILAAKTMNATKLFQNMLETAIDSVAEAKGNNQTSTGMTTTQTFGATDTAPNQLDAIFDQASKTYGVDKQLLLAVARTESNFTPTATSGSGAMGVMQLMPQTAADLGVKNAYDPTDNIMGGAKLLAMLLTRYQGDKAKALAAYNAGGNRVDKYGGVPPEIQGYVNKVMSYYSQGISISDQQLSAAMKNDYKESAVSNGVAAATTNYTNQYSNSSGSGTLFATGNISQNSTVSLNDGVDQLTSKLKTAFSKFPEHQSYESFLEELALEMKNDGQPSDAQGAYQMLLANAKTAISRVREKVAAADADLLTLGMQESDLLEARVNSDSQYMQKLQRVGDAIDSYEKDDDIEDIDDEEDYDDYDDYDDDDE